MPNDSNFFARHFHLWSTKNADVFNDIDPNSSHAGWGALQRQNTEISKQIFPEKEYRGLSPNFHIHASVSDLYIPVLLEEICRPILGLYKSLTDTWMWKLGLRGRAIPRKGIHKWDFAVQCGEYGRFAEKELSDLDAIWFGSCDMSI